MEKFEKIIYKLVSEQKLSPQDAATLLMVTETCNEKEKVLADDIAVIGMACRLPKTTDTDVYWDNLKSGRECIDTFPQSRRKDSMDSMRNKPDEKKGDPFLKGGYLEDVDKFDYGFFHLSPHVAKWIDPGQRMFLTTAWETFEDAGYSEQMIKGTNTGVYVGIDHTYREKYGEDAKDKDFAARIGSWTSILSGRVAFHFDLTGPNVVVDAACSSALVSIHLACNAIKNGECDMAIAGGVNYLLSPIRSNDLEMVESPDSTVRTFDENSNGTVWGEGVGAILLKPLKKAIEDRDNIHAIIKGSAVNSDGASGAITAPNAEAQEKVLVSAWKNAGISPETISYIEAHGTGTKMGDPIEIKGLTMAFRHYTQKKQFCGIGSVKPSIGHLVGASGIASIIKVILSMKNKQLPPCINFSKPNPYINFNDSPLYVNCKLNDWDPESGIRRAGVSAFGFSGTNSHVILEEAAPLEESVYSHSLYVLPMSVQREETLSKLAGDYVSHLKKHPELELGDICYTAATGREHYSVRVVVVFTDKQDLMNKLEEIQKDGIKAADKNDIYSGIIKIVKTVSNNTKGEVTEEEIQQLNSGVTLLLDQLEQSNDAEAIQVLCESYVKGVTVDWKQFYKNDLLRRVSIPRYPMRQTRCWVEPASVDSQGINGHPLLGTCLADNPYDVTYQTELSPQTHWMLKDHMIIQKNVLPGTAYLEIAREACSQFLKTDEIELTDIIFMNPLMLEIEERVNLFTIIKKQGDDCDFLICTKNDSEWIRHAEGSAHAVNTEKIDNCNLSDILGRCTKNVQRSDIKVKTDMTEFGERWDNVERVHVGDREMLVELKLNDAFQDDMLNIGLNPALLDNAFNISIRMNDNSNYYLPFSFKSLSVNRKMPERFYSYIKSKGEISEGKETIQFDIQLLDMDGYPFVQVQDYSIKRVHVKEFMGNVEKQCCEMEWEKKTAETENHDKKSGTIVIFKDSKEIAKKLEAELLRQGKEIITVAFADSYAMQSCNYYEIQNQPEDYMKLFDQIKDRNISQIFHMATIFEKRNELWDILDAQNNGLFSLKYILKALTNKKYTQNIDLVLLSEYAKEVTGEEEKIYPENNALFGMGRAIQQEFNNINCRCIDVDKSTKIEILVQELKLPSIDYIAAFRKNERYAEKITRKNFNDYADAAFEVKKDGVYVITGGSGGVGLEIAKYLASKNEVKVCLIARSPIPESKNWDSILAQNKDKKLCKRIEIINAIKEAGSEVFYYQGDVTVEEDMKHVIDTIRVDVGKINGVFHCAGVAGDGLLNLKDDVKFRTVILPKMQGTKIIDKLTRQDIPDILVLFSSIFTLIGGPGQSDYCAANSYLDAYASARNKEGFRTLTINWPGWKEVGMAADYGMTETSGLFHTITTNMAISYLDELLQKNVKEVFVGEFDFEAISYLYDKWQVVFCEEIRTLFNRNMKRLNKKQESGQKQELCQVKIVGKDESELTDVEKTLGSIWAKVLELDEISVYDSFLDMGGDSILATNLLKETEKYYPNEINVSDIFTYMTVSEMAAHLTEKVGRNENSDNYIEEQKESHDDLDRILDMVSSGELTADSALEFLNEN